MNKNRLTNIFDIFQEKTFPCFSKRSIFTELAAEMLKKRQREYTISLFLRRNMEKMVY